MSEPSNTDDNASVLRDQIIGLGERSLRKSYFPQLQKQIEELQRAKAAVESKAAELELMSRRVEESEANYRQIFEFSAEALMVHDVEITTIFDVNGAFTELYGYSRDEALALSIQDLSTGDADDSSARRCVDIAVQHGTNRFEWLARKKGGLTFWADVTLKSAIIAGEHRILATIRDISERKRAEEELAEVHRTLEDKVAQRTQDLERANKEQAVLLERLQNTLQQLVQSEKLAALGALVAGIAHELGTPIGNALMVASTLEEGRREFEKEISIGLRKSTLTSFMEMFGNGCDSLLRNLHRAGDLVTSFKEVSVDQASSRRREFDLREVVREIEIALAPSMRQYKCKINNCIPKGIKLNSYPGPLGQVIGNLASNAISHGFEAHDDGEIRIEAHVQDDDTVRIAFSDNGSGIPEENLSRIFDPFFTTKLGRGGSGLGLHIVFNIVNGILGGAIRVSSALGQGTQFLITIPRIAPYPREAAT